MKAKPIEYKGKKFESIGNLCAFYKHKPHVIHGRLRRGWKLDKAIKTPELNTNKGVDHYLHIPVYF